MHFPYRRGRIAALWLSGGVLAFASGVHADPAPPFKDLLLRAQANAPRLAEANANVRKAEGLAQQAGARPNPTLGLEVENFGGSGRYGGLSAPETTASVQQTLETGGKRQARIMAGRADVMAERLSGRQVQVDFAFDLAIAYTGAEAAQRREGLAQDALTLAEDDARVADALVAAGREAELRSVQARAAVQAARAAVGEARAARTQAFGALTALAGEPAPITSIPVSLLAQAQTGTAAARPDPLASPGYLAAVAGREAAARRIRVEQTRARPDVQVSFGVRRLQDDHATALVAGVSAPLAVFDRNRGAVKAAQAELSAAEARLAAVRLSAEADAVSVLIQAAASGARLAAARQAEATADEAYRLTRTGYEGGKLNLIELLTARRALADARSQTLDATVQQITAQAALARLQGVPPFGDQP